MLRLITVMAALTAGAGQASAQGTQATRTEQTTTRVESRDSAGTKQDRTSQGRFDLVAGQLWGLSPDEVERANLLMKGPRAAFSVANLSPVEVLGIHARSDAERRKYAELFARAHVADVERSLVWNTAVEQARATLPQQPVIAHQPGVKYDIDPAYAGPMGVPRTSLTRAARRAKQ